MQAESNVNCDFENFISERISPIEDNPFFKVNFNRKDINYFQLEKACYLKGFVDGVNITGEVL